MKTKKRLILLATIVLFGCSIAFFYWRKSRQSFERTGNGNNSLPSTASAIGQNKPQSVAPAAASKQAAALATTAIDTRLQFVDMSVGERNLIIDEIRNQDLLTFFRTWVESGRSDRMKQKAVGFVFVQALRDNPPNPEVLAEMRKFIADSSNSSIERTLLLGVLSGVKNKESLDVLIEAATTLTDDDAKQAAINAIRFAGDVGDHGTFHEELSPALERIWRESNEQQLLISTAEAMAKVGAPSGIKLLIGSALTADGIDNVRAHAAQGSLSEVMNPHAVPFLSELLANEPLTSLTSELAASTLNTIGDSTAAKALLNWLQNSDESAAPFAHGYVVRTRTNALLATWQSALDPTVSFRSEKNREAIRTGLAEYRQNHK